LFPPKLNISRYRSLHPRQEVAVLRKEAYADAVFGAEAHQKRTARDVPETDNATDRVDGEPQADFPLHLDDNRFSLLGEVGTLRRDKQGVQMFLHGSLFPFDNRSAFW
jgi:hypothetical protein